MRKLVDQPAIPKDATSSREGMNLVTQAPKSAGSVSDRGSMKLICQPDIKPGVTSNSVESVAPKSGK